VFDCVRQVLSTREIEPSSEARAFSRRANKKQ